LSNNNTALENEPLLGLNTVILDFDDVCYWNTENPYLAFKLAFANAASALLGMNRKHAFRLAIKGWEEKTDAEHWISVVNGCTDDEKIKILKGDLDRLTHRILSTKTWQPFEDMAEAIIGLREQGIRVIVWTHGRREMVLYNMDKLIGAGAFKECDIFDKQSLPKAGFDDLRKDRGTEPYLRLCGHLGIQPHQALLVDNEPRNLVDAYKSGFQRGIHIITPREHPLTQSDHVRLSTNNTATALQELSDKIALLRRTVPANSLLEPRTTLSIPVMKTRPQ
jgi:FMN phosphatase YigB (HAD superfamily)